MRDFIKISVYVHDLDIDQIIEDGATGFVAQDGTPLTTTQGTVVPKLVPFMLSAPTYSPVGRTLKNSITINPYNFDYSVRKFTETDTLESIEFANITYIGNGGGMGADKPVTASITVYAQAPYRSGSAKNPYPAMLRLVAHGSNSIDVESIMKQFKNCIESSDKSLFTVTMAKTSNGFTVKVDCLEPRKLSYELSDNVAKLINHTTPSYALAITQTKLSGYLTGSYIDARYASINDGANPRFDRMAKGNTYAKVIVDDEHAITGECQLIITTKESNQYPVIAGDDNSPEKMIIIESNQSAITKMEVVLKAIKAKVNGTVYEPRAMRSSMGIPVAELSPELTDKHTGEEVPTEVPEVTPPIVTDEEPIVKITDSGVQSA